MGLSRITSYNVCYTKLLRTFFEAKWREQIQRHAKQDDAISNLEPNVKESPGGLRDIQTIGWVAKRHFGALSP